MPVDTNLIFSTAEVTNGLVILAVLLSGYLLYLKKKGRNNTKGKDDIRNEIEAFLDVLGLGSFVVGTIYISEILLNRFLMSPIAQNST